MNIYLQVGLGLLPGVIAAVFLLFRRRAFNFNKIIITLALTAGCLSSIIYGASSFLSERTVKSAVSEKEMLVFANALAKEEACDEAMEVIDQYSEKYGYDDKCRLLAARISLLQEDYERAAGLYKYLYTDTDMISQDSAEVVYAEKKNTAKMADTVMIEYLKGIGEDIEDYGYTEAGYNDLKDIAKISPDEIKEEVKNKIESEYKISDKVSSCAETVSDVTKLYSETLKDVEDTTGRYKREFNNIEKDLPGYTSLECVNRARIKAYIAAGDSEELTQTLNNASSYHDLMIAAELYMNGLVNRGDFPESYQKVSSIDASSVKDRITRIYNKSKKKLTVQEDKALKSRVDAVSAQFDDPALITIKEHLTVAADKEAGTDRSKVCLELAKIENYFGNETSTDSYLSEAIYSSQDCQDNSYATGMSQIIGVIENDENSDTENIKNVSKYVDTVLDHSLTVDIEDIVSSQNNSDNRQNTNDFTKTAVDYVSRIKSSISIGRIDTSNFDEITATVQIDSDYISDPAELKKAISVYDCGAQITDFSLEKINYTGSNIILVCDVSGSMSGSIQNLRDAVVTFIKEKNTYENLSVVTFCDSIVETKSFGTPDNELISFAESMNAYGGTDMFSAVVNCLSGFSSDKGKNNVLILMTDGQDNNPKSSDEIYSDIGRTSIEKGITVYTLGLGAEVDTAYLGMIAGSGNGDFIYVSDSASLTSFYDMLHSQLNSQYSLKYKAQDTMTMSGRTLEVQLAEENIRDIKTYSLDGYAETEGGLTISQDLDIECMSPRFIYKGLQNISVKLKGSGFKPESSITVKLNGNLDYTLDAKYVDSETYSMTVPASVAVGNYDVDIMIDGKKKVLQDGFMVLVQGSEKKTVFGPYVFTSSEVIDNGNTNRTLSGNVTMNGWLHFKGDITLSGNLTEDASINVSDYKGSFVEFDTATAEGIGSYMAERGISINIPALQGFRLYNDKANIYDYEKYQVDKISVGLFKIYNVMRLKSPVIQLYPNSIGLEYSTGTSILPYQDKLIKATGNNLDLFSFSYKGSMQITNKNVGLIMDMDYSDPKSTYNNKINLLNSPVYFNGSFKLKINTLKNEYTVGAMVRMAFFAAESGLGAEVSWKEHLIPDSVKLSLELAQGVKLPTTIPIEVNKFGFSVSDINSAIEKGTYKNLMFTGSATFTSAELKYYIPGIENFLGDISLFEMPDTTASIRVSPFTFQANAELKFLSEIKLAEAGVSLGTFPYENSLLGIRESDVNGFSASVKKGLMWESGNKNISFEISGEGELDLHSRFMGVDYKGVMSGYIDFWLLSFEKRADGEAALGFYTTSDNKLEMVLAYRGYNSDGKVGGGFYYINENGISSSENGRLH